MNQFQNLKQSNKQPQQKRTNNMTESLRPLHDTIILTNLEVGESKSAGGIIIADDDGKEHGIRTRWAQIYAVGPEQKDVKVGEWVLMQHGRWTRGQDFTLKGQKPFRFWKADPKGILGVSTTGKPKNIKVQTHVDTPSDPQ